MKKPLLDDVTIEVTNACQLHCRQCDIWREKERHEIGMQLLVRTMDRLLGHFQIRSVSITGGEPFFHKDISGIIRYLAGLKIKRRINSFGVYTNGACFETITQVLGQNKKFLKDVCIGVSLDGMKRTHDALRGVGSYGQTMKTLKLLKDQYAGACDVELKFTINRSNCRDLFKVYELALKSGFRFTPKLMEENVGAYYHRVPRVGRNKFFGEGGGCAVMDDLQRQLTLILKSERVRSVKAADPLMLKMLWCLARGGTDVIQWCETPGRCLFITSRGKVYPCLYMEPAGALDKNDLCSRAFFKKRDLCIKNGRKAQCSGCFSYHGFLKEFNIKGFVAGA